MALQSLVSAAIHGAYVGATIPLTERESSTILWRNVVEMVHGAKNVIGDSPDEFEAAVKAIVIGTLRAATAMGNGTVKTVRYISDAVINAVDDSSDDVRAATRGLIEGAIASANIIMMSPHEAAIVAGCSAIDTASNISQTAVQQIRKILEEPIDGVIVKGKIQAH